MCNSVRVGPASFVRRRAIFRAAALWIGALLSCSASAQAIDTASIAERIEKLNAELQELRSENAAIRKQLNETSQAAAPSPAKAAAATLKLGGELRLRYENFDGDNPAFFDRSRMRLRLRFGATAALANNFEAGLRLTTGVSEGEPTGNNATWQDNASKKAIALDLAYIKWTALKSDADSLALIVGKMLSPLTSSDLVFDNDYTPEGFAAQYSRKFGKQHTVRANAAVFVIDELSASSDDPMLFANQLRWDAAWNSAWSSTVGITSLQLSDAVKLTNAAVPDVHKGNTRTAGGVLVNNYRPWLFDFALTHVIAGIPVKLAGDYMENPGASRDNQGYFVGLYIGKTAARGTWEFNYRYRVAEPDAWYEELIDSDSGAFYQAAPPGGSVGYGGGTNVRGHIFAGSYAVTDYALVGFTYFALNLVRPSPIGSDSDMGRLQINTIVKF